MTWFHRLCSENMRKVESITGRKYGLFDYVGCPQAERIVISMGSSCEVLEEVVNYLHQQGEKSVWSRFRLFRPFSIEHLSGHSFHCQIHRRPWTAPGNGGSLGEPLYKDVCTAFYEGGAPQNPSLLRRHLRPGFQGLHARHGQGCFRQPQIHAAQNHFSVGIDDDVTYQSLEVGRKRHLGSRNPASAFSGVSARTERWAPTSRQ